jgi:hypothetical protein
MESSKKGDTDSKKYIFILMDSVLSTHSSV